MSTRTLVLNGKLAAVWYLHEDGSIEHFHFAAQPGGDENRVLLHAVSRPGDEDYESLVNILTREVVS